MRTRVKLFVWEKLFTLPRAMVHAIFQNRNLMRLLFPGGTFGANGLDSKLTRYLSEIDRGFFIEIGGNDGITQSNTKYLELFHGWRGLLVEPEPENFRRMSMTRASQTHLVRAACVDYSYASDEVELSSGDLMSVSLSLPVDLEDTAAHIRESRKYLKRQLTSDVYTAPARTLDSILDDIGAPTQIDFFSLDVEGAELPVLRGLDLRGRKITYILVESRSPSEMDKYLQSCGYKMTEKLTNHDYLFVRVES